MTRKIKPPVAIYSALADASRCRIVEILRSGAKPVHELADAFSISRPAISRHLRVLKEAGLVTEVKKGRENLYALRAARLEKAIDWIAATSSTASETVPEAAAPAPSQPKKPVEARSAPLVPVEPVPADVVPDDIPRAVIVQRAAKRTAVDQMGFDF